MRIINCSFSVVFMLMLALPLVLVDLSSGRISVQENRMLAERPPLADIKANHGSFIRQFDAWFKDSTGFRKQLVSLYNAIDKNKLLNGEGEVRYTDGPYTFLIGRQGHHYFADVNGKLIPKFQGNQFISDELLQRMASKLDDVKQYLDNKGIPLVVMLCADKESVYPEFYPKFIRRGPEPIQLEVITKYLQEHTSVDVFNIREALLEKKNDNLLYYLIDAMWFTSDFAHYNEIGAFFSYRELMKHINIHGPYMVPYELDDVEISYDEKDIPHVSLKMEKTYYQLDSSFFDAVTWENVTYENIEPDLPVILFLCDSYAAEHYIGKYFAQQFGKAIFIHYRNISRIEEYIDWYNPDVVVFESAERQLEWFANVVAGIPEFRSPW
jgi:hypothetical protein